MEVYVKVITSAPHSLALVESSLVNYFQFQKYIGMFHHKYTVTSTHYFTKRMTTVRGEGQFVFLYIVRNRGSGNVLVIQ